MRPFASEKPLNIILWKSGNSKTWLPPLEGMAMDTYMTAAVALCDEILSKHNVTWDEVVEEIVLYRRHGPYYKRLKDYSSEWKAYAKNQY